MQIEISDLVFLNPLHVYLSFEEQLVRAPVPWYGKMEVKNAVTRGEALGKKCPRVWVGWFLFQQQAVACGLMSNGVIPAIAGCTQEAY